MNGKDLVFNSTIASLGTALTAWFGGWDITLKVLVYLMVLDYITGFLGAVRQKKVNSEVMYWGGIRKLVILSLVALAVLLDYLFSNPEPILRTFLAYYYIGREGVSMVENVGKIGLPMPAKFKGAFEQLQDKGGSK